MHRVTELTERQERFAVVFAENGGNAAKAARSDGYAEKSVRGMGSRLFNRPPGLFHLWIT